MKVWLIIIFFALLLGGGVWVWSLGNLPPETSAATTLVTAQGDVRVQAPGQAWVAASAGQTLVPGSLVQTGQYGEATVRFFDRAETRLAPSSTLDILSATHDPVVGSLAVRLKLEAGRIWSRVLQLTDLSSGFAVETQDAVATVRGTAFDLEKDPSATVVAGFDGALSLDEAQGSLAVPEGFQARLAPGPLPIKPDPIPLEVLAGDWSGKNQAADEAFAQGARERARATLPSASGTPGSFLARLTEWSEAWHVSRESPANAPILQARYLARRFLAWRAQADAGSSGTAFQAFSDFQQTVKAPNAFALRQAAVLALARSAWMFEDVSPRDAAYRLKQGLEDLRVSLMSDPGDALFVRLLAVSQRLYEARAAMDVKDSELTGNALDAADQSLQNIDRDAALLPGAYDPNRLQSLTEGRQALHAWLAALQARAATSTGNVPPTVPVVPPTATSTSPVSTSTTPVITCQRLLLTASANPALVGQTVTLQAYGIRSDRSRVNLTASAHFQTTGAAAALNKNLLTPEAAGQIAVSAVAVCSGATLNGALALTAVAPAPVAAPVPRSLAVSANPVQVPFGQTSKLDAVVTYSDGSSKDVTSAMTFFLSDSSLGSVSGDTFTASQKATGTEHISGSYTENGATVSGAVDVTVVQ